MRSAFIGLKFKTMELEVKHLAPYLPYSLKLQYVVREKVEKNGIMTSIVHNKNETHPTKVSIDWYNEEHIWMFKPILRPLSDLHSEFIIGDIYPFNSLSKRSRMDLEENNGNPLIMKYAYEDIQILLEYHYDIFGLINKELAVDINSIPLADA